jgi:hypothetical protein
MSGKGRVKQVSLFTCFWGSLLEELGKLEHELFKARHWPGLGSFERVLGAKHLSLATKISKLIQGINHCPSFCLGVKYGLLLRSNC